MFKWSFNRIPFYGNGKNKDLVTTLKRNFNKKWWLVNEELLHTMKPVLSAILFNKYLGIKIKNGIYDILLFYDFDSDICSSIDLLFL